MASNHTGARDRRTGALGNLLFRATSAMHILLYRLTRGKIGGRMMGAPVLLLTTTGRKTGNKRTKPLMYFPDGERMVLIASKGGSAENPAWWLNLQHNPRVQVEVDGKVMIVTAEPASPEERTRLWPKITAMFSGYADYQTKTTREIPLAILRPAGEERA